MYATEYVRCHACHRINTDLVKDEMIRKWMLVCRDCKCTRTISVTLKASEKNFADYEKEKKEWKRKAMENAE
jgi:translation initiation factor 2 beta subunit (eIF-2beta)/eIF-5